MSKFLSFSNLNKVGVSPINEAIKKLIRYLNFSLTITIVENKKRPVNKALEGCAIKDNE